jgi:hypothetical protein
MSVGDPVPAVGEEFAGVLRFPDGPDVPIAGTVVRAGVGFDRMVSEQRRILRAFPGFLSRAD